MNLCARCLADLAETERTCPRCGLVQPDVVPPAVSHRAAEESPGEPSPSVAPDPTIDADANAGAAHVAAGELWISGEMPLVAEAHAWPRWLRALGSWTRRRWPFVAAAVALVAAGVAALLLRPAWTLPSTLAHDLSAPPSVAWQLNASLPDQYSSDGERVLSSLENRMAVLAVETGEVLWSMEPTLGPCYLDEVVVCAGDAATAGVLDRETGAELRRLPGQAVGVVGDVVLVVTHDGGQGTLRAKRGDNEVWHADLGPLGDDTEALLIPSSLGSLPIAPRSDLAGLVLSPKPGAPSDSTLPSEALGVRVSDGTVLLSRRPGFIVPMLDAFMWARSPDVEGGQTARVELVAADGTETGVTLSRATQTHSASGQTWNIVSDADGVRLANSSWKPLQGHLPEGALPLACGDVLVAVPSSLFDSPGPVSAFDSRGRELWTHAVDGGVGGVCTPTSVVVFSADGSIAALSQRTGAVIWEGKVDLPAEDMQYASVRATPHGILVTLPSFITLLR